MNHNILFIEDEQDLGNVFKHYLEMFNFSVTWHTGSREALDQLMAGNDRFDIILIDVSMPDMNGFELAEEIVKLGLNIPFLFLTARNEKSDRLRGLKLGAHDYIVKPFDIDELVVRVQNIIRRTKNIQADMSRQPVLKKGDVRFDKAAQSIMIKDGPPIALTSREAELIEYLFKNENRVLKREEILSQLWGEDTYFMGRSLDVFVSRLRKHLGPSGRVSIDNIYGVGFKFVVKD